MKKLIALLLAVIMVLSMAACNNTNVNPTEDNNKQTEPDPTVETTTAPTETEPVVDNTLVEYYRRWLPG